ncbi:MAG: hypothetical protein ACJ768_16845, partial [Gaiellaceae bacterium]
MPGRSQDELERPGEQQPVASSPRRSEAAPGQAERAIPAPAARPEPNRAEPPVRAEVERRAPERPDAEPAAATPTERREAQPRDPRPHPGAREPSRPLPVETVRAGLPARRLGRKPEAGRPASDEISVTVEIESLELVEAPAGR